MIVRWALLLHKKSKSAYRYIRDSALVCLPSERTLSDYRCYKPLSTGVDTPYIFEVAEKFGKQDVTILIDEMKVSAGLTYSVSTGELCGYVDSLDADTLLDVSQSTASPDTASHALCFMARGLKSNLQAVVATYATHCLNAEQLYNRFWHVVSCCELAGLRVRCCVSDGASINRKFIKLHCDDFPDDPITYRAVNRFSKEQRVLFFASDTCHLVKTTRNCLESSGRSPTSRRLVVSFYFDFNIIHC